MMNAIQAVFIAAGDSSRFWPLNNGSHKTELSLFGRPILYWTAKGLVDQGIEEIIVVCKKNSTIPVLTSFQELKADVKFVFQQEALGTGDALWQAKDFIQGPFFLVWPNKIEAGEIAKEILEKQREGAEVVLCGTRAENLQDFGIFQMEGDKVLSIIEKPEPGKEPSKIRRAGIELLPEDFFSAYEQLPFHHATDIIDALNLLIQKKKTQLIVKEQLSSLKYPWDAFALMDALFKSRSFTPEKAATAKIASTAVVGKDVYVGENVKIGEYTVIEGPAYIGEDCEIGSHNVLRGPVNLEKEVRTGAFCEIKNSIVQEGTHFHSGYVGNSIIGKNCRLGAGIITGNKRLDRGAISSVVKGKKQSTGLSSFGTVMGDNTRVGVSCSIMPGVLIGSHCMIGPATVVSENLESHSLLYAEQTKIVKKKGEHI
ncbi:MAG: sugar phosphate nucleotidyltransferase [Candidatus Yanofskybacteria bacterium]|nr:sugar phosphate nucleotidyltransferase [Candidatus Yanofskybacteria bacterium]